MSSAGEMVHQEMVGPWLAPGKQLVARQGE
jgi:hypothetical protein